MDKEEKKVALVTGSSSGIGYYTAIALAREGFHTYATMRDLKKADDIVESSKKDNLSIEVLELDVDKDESVRNAVDNILKDKGRIDALVNNAGYGLFGCAEVISIDELKAQFETNFFGALRMIQAVLPTMRRQNFGTIVNVSSLAGRIGFPASPGYITSKFALEGLGESLRYELSSSGVRVVTIEPGAVNTGFMKKGMRKGSRVDTDTVYRDLTQNVISGVTMMLEMGTDPKEVANTIAEAIKSEDPLPRYAVGNDAKMFLDAKKRMSDLEFENYVKKELFQQEG